MLTYASASRLSKDLTNSVGRYIDKQIGKKSDAAHYLKVGVFIGIAATSVGFIARAIYRRLQAAKSHGQVDAIRDKTLKDSFPASDPPASQYFDIPVNRQ